MAHSFEHLSPKDRLAIKLAMQSKKRKKTPVKDHFGNRSATGPDKGQSFKNKIHGTRKRV
jgi:hypothetical protein